MRRVKYTPEPLISWPACSYLQKAHMKPAGLWYSCIEDDAESWGWREWCEAEHFRLADLRYETEVRIEGKILAIHSEAEFLGFADVYKAPGPVPGLARMYIDWPRVAEVYDGIEITPYLWSMRLDFMWYYGWDCSSGVLWNLDALRGFGPSWEQRAPPSLTAFAGR